MLMPPAGEKQSFFLASGRAGRKIGVAPHKGAPATASPGPEQKTIKATMRSQAWRLPELFPELW